MTLAFTGGDGVTQIDGTAAFTHVVTVPGRDFDDDVALHDGLAAEPGMQREAGRHVQAVGFVIVHLRQVPVCPVLHDHVTGRTGAASTAGVFEMNAVIQSDVEEGFRLPMIGIRKLTRFEFHSPAFGQERHFGHVVDYNAEVRPDRSDMGVARG